MDLCFASNNEHKFSEIRPLLEPDFRILSLSEIGCREELSETQSTLEGNSLQKAEYVFTKFGVPCIADDSGLEVTALNGAPGVFSARYAGEQKNSNDNIALLLKNLRDTPDRSARFRTVITLVGLGEPLFFEGSIEGTIAMEKKGTGGFGYDPVFIPQGHGRTFAEMSLEEKNTLSHRSIAVQKMIEFLKNYTTKHR